MKGVFRTNCEFGFSLNRLHEYFFGLDIEKIWQKSCMENDEGI